MSQVYQAGSFLSSSIGKVGGLALHKSKGERCARGSGIRSHAPATAAALYGPFGVGEGFGAGVGVGDGEGCGVGVGEGWAVGDGEGDGSGVAVGDGAGVGVSVGNGANVGDGPATGTVGAGVAISLPSCGK
jgi:hypothetical protein